MNTIVHIVNNPGNIKDGIGLYGNNLAGHLKNDGRVKNVILEGADTTDLTKFGMVVSLKMTNAIIRAKNDIKGKEGSIVIIEYPFQEYNPLIVPVIYLLKRQIKKQNGLLILSVHEYLRANILRKNVIETLVSLSDIIFVTDEKTKEALQCRNTNIFTREIPSVILFGQGGVNKPRNRNKYIFMGLVNKSKAFSEMINAWKEFNHNGEKFLDIYTSSDVLIDEPEKFNIHMYKGADDETVAAAMQQATFCVCPIKPYITKANSSFTSACLAGCIVIGAVDTYLQNEMFIITMKDYTEEVFLRALRDSDLLKQSEIDKKSIEAVEFGKRTNKNYTQVAKEFLDICDKYWKMSYSKECS